MTDQADIKKGLAGVVADYTAISKVNAETNSLLYRGYPVQDLAQHRKFEEVALLLWDGELPTEERRAEHVQYGRAHRSITPELKAVIDAMPTDCHPMDVCRTAVSFLGFCDPKSEDNSPETELKKAWELFAIMPSIVCYDQRRRHGLDIIEPRDDLDYAQNFLWMAFGEVPADEVRDAFNVSMVLYAEHSFNASTFTARAITSTLSDLHSAVAGAIGALKGPLHGGANEAVMHTFNEIGFIDGESEDDAKARARAWMEDALAQKKKIMGFGHRVYKNGDSRVPTMQDSFFKMVEHYDRQDMVGLYKGLAEAMDEAKGIKPNLDYPAGPTYHLMGFDTPTFTPIFVCARVAGWTTHILEQRANNSLIRPLSAYNGVEQRKLS